VPTSQFIATQFIPHGAGEQPDLASAPDDGDKDPKKASCRFSPEHCSQTTILSGSDGAQPPFPLMQGTNNPKLPPAKKSRAQSFPFQPLRSAEVY